MMTQMLLILSRFTLRSDVTSLTMIGTAIYSLNMI